MKNTIPLIVAVVFGLAAIYGVSRLISANLAEEEKKYVMVVAAAKDITPKDGEIKDSWITRRRVEISSLPAKAIRWNEANRVIGQGVTRTVAKGDYVLASDVSGVEVRLANAVAPGEWAVPVTFSESRLVRFLTHGIEAAGFRDFMARDLTPYDLVFFADDNLARGGLLAMTNRGLRAPEDIKVVSWANFGQAPVYLRDLTRMELNPITGGEKVAEAVIKYLKTQVWERDVTLTPTWIDGETI